MWKYLAGIYSMWLYLLTKEVKITKENKGYVYIMYSGCATDLVGKKKNQQCNKPA